MSRLWPRNVAMEPALLFGFPNKQAALAGHSDEGHQFHQPGAHTPRKDNNDEATLSARTTRPQPAFFLAS